MCSISNKNFVSVNKDEFWNLPSLFPSNSIPASISRIEMDLLVIVHEGSVIFQKKKKKPVYWISLTMQISIFQLLAGLFNPVYFYKNPVMPTTVRQLGISQGTL